VSRFVEHQKAYMSPDVERADTVGLVAVAVAQGMKAPNRARSIANCADCIVAFSFY
jgi:hypothetical protein